MSVLDNMAGWSEIDPKDMRSMLAEFPGHFRSALQDARGISLGPVQGIANIVITGLGGSAIGGDVIRSAVGDSLSVPLIVNRDYMLPSFVSSATLVVASSYSGNTEETLSAYEHAKQLGATIVCITTGGRLAQSAKSDGFPVIRVPVGLPPRAALGYSSTALLGVLHALGQIPGFEKQLEEVVELLSAQQLRFDPAVTEANNLAKQIARSLHGKIVAIYGSNAVLESAAARWRGQIEENAKNLAFHHLLPEMNHNELVGWKYPEEVLRCTGVVLLRDSGDHPQVKRRFDFTKALLVDRAGSLHEVWSEGRSLPARIFSTIYLGDYVSLYMACLNGVDPTPVEVIDQLKAALSAQ